ncbi:hypothetical protein GCM10027612_84270 [Microbispora bryophytorum subsp. camponoti]
MRHAAVQGCGKPHPARPPKNTFTHSRQPSSGRGAAVVRAGGAKRQHARVGRATCRVTVPDDVRISNRFIPCDLPKPREPPQRREFTRMDSVDMGKVSTFPRK